MSAVMEANLLHEDWLQELPEDLDVCIAQRDFEGAVDLIDKGKGEFSDCFAPFNLRWFYRNHL